MTTSQCNIVSQWLDAYTKLIPDDDVIVSSYTIVASEPSSWLRTSAITKINPATYHYHIPFITCNGIGIWQHLLYTPCNIGYAMQYQFNSTYIPCYINDVMKYRPILMQNKFDNNPIIRDAMHHQLCQTSLMCVFGIPLKLLYSVTFIWLKHFIRKCNDTYYRGSYRQEICVDWSRKSSFVNFTALWWCRVDTFSVSLSLLLKRSMGILGCEYAFAFIVRKYRKCDRVRGVCLRAVIHHH